MAQDDYSLLVYPSEDFALTSGNWQFLQDLEELARIEQEFIIAQRVITNVDIYALGLTAETIQYAELLKALSGWSAKLEEFDRQRRGRFFETMHELVSSVHVKVLSRLKR